jgi:MtN3 and saliva related transmembrane protein
LTTTDFIGLASGGLTTAAFLPQVWKVWRTRSARDISLHMYLVFSAGLAGWMVYGALIGSAPILAANSVTLLLAGSVILMKRRFDRGAAVKK